LIDCFGGASDLLGWERHPSLVDKDHVTVSLWAILGLPSWHAFGICIWIWFNTNSEQTVLVSAIVSGYKINLCVGFVPQCLFSFSKFGLRACCIIISTANSSLLELFIGESSWGKEPVLEASGDLGDEVPVVGANLTVVLELQVGEVVRPKLWLDIHKTVPGVVLAEQLG
jgi:hypothetical protein